MTKLTRDSTSFARSEMDGPKKKLIVGGSYNYMHFV
jgi:hypothetical protein